MPARRQRLASLPRRGSFLIPHTSLGDLDDFMADHIDASRTAFVTHRSVMHGRPGIRRGILTDRSS